jgi:ABC-type transporter Mla maintaining outer membrane lipid asymmetry ATPase subunit MlaF
MISIRDLTVRYGSHQVLNGVNLDVEQGEVMVLLGSSGSAKARCCARSPDSIAHRQAP